MAELYWQSLGASITENDSEPKAGTGGSVVIGGLAALCALVLGVGGTSTGRHDLQNIAHSFGLADAYVPEPTAAQRLVSAQELNKFTDHLAQQRASFENLKDKTVIDCSDLKEQRLYEKYGVAPFGTCKKGTAWPAKLIK